METGTETDHSVVLLLLYSSGDLTIRRKNYTDVCHHAFSPAFIVFVNEV